MIPVNLPSLLLPNQGLQVQDRGSRLPKLANGQVVEGKILKQLPGDQVLLSINGRELTARTRFPVKPGQTLAFRVETTQPLPMLKPVGIKAAGLPQLRAPRVLAALMENIWQTMGQQAGRGNGADQTAFNALLKELSMGIFSKAEAGLLPAIIDKSGLSLETKLKKEILSQKDAAKWLPRLLGDDLKGLAARMLGQKSETSALLEKFVATLEDIQVLNHHALHGEGKIFLPLPLQFADGFFTMGQLLLQLPTEREAGREGAAAKEPFYRAVFMLEMSRLGPLRAEIGLKAKMVFGKLLTTSDASTKMVRQGLPTLRAALAAQGFAIDYLECWQKDAATVAKSLLDEVLPPDQDGFTSVA